MLLASDSNPFRVFLLRQSQSSDNSFLLNFCACNKAEIPSLLTTLSTTEAKLASTTAIKYFAYQIWQNNFAMATVSFGRSIEFTTDEQEMMP